MGDAGAGPSSLLYDYEKARVGSDKWMLLLEHGIEQLHRVRRDAESRAIPCCIVGVGISIMIVWYV